MTSSCHSVRRRAASRNGLSTRSCNTRSAGRSAPVSASCSTSTSIPACAVGDAATVGKQHVRNGVISLQTEKTGQRVDIPLLDVLKRTLDVGPTGDLSFNATRAGHPFKKESLGNAFKDACKLAGIKDKSAHGLRKAAATRAADNGATAHELMAIFGWKDIKEVELYTRAANRKRLAAQAMKKLEA